MRLNVPGWLRHSGLIVLWAVTVALFLTPSFAVAEEGPSFRVLVGRELTGDRFVMRVNMDGTFELRAANGSRVTGVHSYIPGRLTLLDPRNNTLGLSFPKRCRVTQISPDALRLESLEGSCQTLGNQVFRLPSG